MHACIFAKNCGMVESVIYGTSELCIKKTASYLLSLMVWYINYQPVLQFLWAAIGALSLQQCMRHRVSVYIDGY